MTPSAIVWGTSQNRHVTRQVVEAACEVSQKVSYRKAVKQRTEESGKEQLLSTTTIWNKKQKIGKVLEQKQNTLSYKARKSSKNQGKSPENIAACAGRPKASSPSPSPPRNKSEKQNKQ